MAGKIFSWALLVLWIKHIFSSNGPHIAGYANPSLTLSDTHLGRALPPCSMAGYTFGVVLVLEP
jgi:hypothetical protein